jgi:hypothetical protein
VHRKMVEAQLYMMLGTVRQSRTSRQVVKDETREERTAAALKTFRTMAVYELRKRRASDNAVHLSALRLQRIALSMSHYKRLNMPPDSKPNTTE